MIVNDSDVVDIPKFADMEIDARVEIFAFMRAQGYKPADNRASSGRFVRAPGGRGRTAPSGPARREVPPRGRADITCVNCGRKGHSGQECKQPRRDKADRPCFNCGKTSA